jgi:hypothetical protein
MTCNWGVCAVCWERETKSSVLSSTTPSVTAVAPANGQSSTVFGAQASRSSSSTGAQKFKEKLSLPKVTFSGSSRVGWDSSLSDSTLVFSNNKLSVERIGGKSCYPAAMTKIQAPQSTLAIRLDAAPLNGNILSFGVATTSFKKDFSDGVGKETQSWGFFDDRRASDTSACKLYSDGAIRGELPGKLSKDDIIFIEVDTIECWIRFNVVRNGHLFFRVRAIFDRKTSNENYVFATTLANDHKLTILPYTKLEHDAAPAVCPYCQSKLERKPAGVWGKEVLFCIMHCSIVV